MAAHERPRDAAAARLRGAGARAQLGPPRALPAALGRGQLAGGRADHAGQLLPRAAPPGAPQLPQAAGGDDAEVAAAPQGCGVDASRTSGRARRSTACWPRPTQLAPAPRCGACCCAAARSTSTSSPSGASARSTTSPSSASSSSIPSRSRGSASGSQRYPQAEVVWCQEEPENMGAWHFVDRRIERALATIDVTRQAAGLYRPARNRRRRPPARRAIISRSRPTWSTARSHRLRRVEHGRRNQGSGAG